MAAAQHRVLLPFFILAALATWSWKVALGSGLSSSFVMAAGQRESCWRKGFRPTQRPRVELNRASPVAAKARGGEDADAESIGVSGFSGFVVGLAILPHVINSLVVSFGVIVSGDSFALGPYGLELISCTTTVGLTLWSVGSFIERGRGLPAGPLGLLGLSEGLSYLGCLLLVVAGLASTTRGNVQVAVTTVAPTPTQISVPAATPTPKAGLPASLSAPTSAPSIKVPEAPKFDVPKFEAPKLEVPKFETPKFSEVKPPEAKKPEAPPAKKVPEVKAPEVKKPEVKASGPKKVPEAATPAKPAASTSPDYESLFD